MTPWQVVDQYADDDEPVIPVTFATREEAEAWIAAEDLEGRYLIQYEGPASPRQSKEP